MTPVPVVATDPSSGTLGKEAVVIAAQWRLWPLRRSCVRLFKTPMSCVMKRKVTLRNVLSSQ
jgi:hypothetical protein